MMADYIEREAAVKAAQYGADEWDGGYNRNRDMYIEAAIDKLPVADVKPVVRGEWIWTETGDEDYEQFWVCSVCGEHDFYEANYCPNCGADMRGESDG